MSPHFRAVVTRQYQRWLHQAGIAGAARGFRGAPEVTYRFSPGDGGAAERLLETLRRHFEEGPEAGGSAERP